MEKENKKQNVKNANLDLYEKLRNVPDEAKIPIEGGRLKGKTAINTMWRIKRLTEQFGPCGIGWNYRVSATRTEELASGQKALFVDIFLKYKIPGSDAWSEEIPGTGGNILVSNEQRNGLYLNDDAYKMAISDAISNASKLLGLGADVYFENDVENKYNEKTVNTSAVENTPAPVKTTGQPNSKQAAFVNGRSNKPEMHKLHPQWNYSIAVIAASTDTPQVLRQKLETMYTITDSNFNELLRLAGRKTA